MKAALYGCVVSTDVCAIFYISLTQLYRFTIVFFRETRNNKNRERYIIRFFERHENDIIDERQNNRRAARKERAQHVPGRTLSLH